MLLAELVETSRRVAATASRNEKVEILAGLLRRLAPEERTGAVAFLVGEVPGGKIGIGWASVMKARVAPSAQASLHVAEVARALDVIATTSGRGSAAARREGLGALFARATELEQDFLGRLLVGELRQGALEGVLAEAVAKAADVPSGKISRALLVAGSLVEVAQAALAGGEGAIDALAIQLFRPLAPMLAQPVEGTTEALALHGEAALEWKLDGARIQVHKQGDDVRVYSRGANDVTVAVPEVVALARALGAREAILDGEVIALRDDGSPHTFQTTMRRFGRKLDVARLAAELPLTPVLFDLMFQDGADLTQEPHSRRVDGMRAIVPAANVVPHLVTADPAQAEAFLRDALRRGHEGILAKAPGSTYEAGRRGTAWLKCKPAHTLDLVVLAAEWGHGRRQGFLSNLHLGARDEERGGFCMLGKTFKGLTDATLAWQTRELLAREIAREDHVVHVRPELVVEVAFNDLQVSPHYPGGLALRFARVKRYRTDKSASEADTLATVRLLAGDDARARLS